MNMTAATFFHEVEELLFSALVASVSDAVNEFSGESIYALILYPAGGFTSFGLAISSRERINASPATQGIDSELLSMLEKHPDLLAKSREHEVSPNYFLMTACEWDYFAEKQFAQLNNYLRTNYDSLYDLGQTPEKIEESFAELLISVIQRAKFDNCFLYPNVEPEPFLGFQYADTGNRPLMLHVSKNVNSSAWHDLAIAEWNGS